MIIYKCTNKINGKVYIGQTIKTLSRRLSGHLSQKTTHRNLFQNALKKYGTDGFSIEVIDSAKTKEALSIKEIYWIKYYNCVSPNGYNLTSGGEQASPSEYARKAVAEANKKRIWTQEARDKIRIASSLRRHTPEEIAKIAESNSRRGCSDETKKKIGDANKGKQRTQEQKDRQTEMLIKRWKTREFTDEHKQKMLNGQMKYWENRRKDLTKIQKSV